MPDCRKPGMRLSTIVGSCYYVAPEVSPAAMHTQPVKAVRECNNI